MQDYDEDDLYADILNDDIIKLDESSLSATPSNMLPVVANNSVAEQNYEAANNSEAEQNYEVPVHASVSQPILLQGTANRRIRLRKLEAIYTSGTSKCGYFIEKTKCPSSPKRSISSARITVMSPLLFVIFVFMTLMVLLLALLGGLRHVKCIVYKSLCQGFSK